MSEKRLAVVTGAARGIGRAIVLELLREGRAVAGLDINQEQLDELKEVVQKEGFEVEARLCDITNLDELTKTLDELSEAYGGVGILVNNAGVTRDKLMMQMEEQDYDIPLNVNLKAAFMATKTVLRAMVKNKFGRVVNISSVAGVMGQAGSANYAASKSGLIGMSKSLAREVGKKNVTVNCIAPGFIETDMTSVLPDSVKNAAKAVIPMRKYGRPEDVAKAVAFLSRDESSYITGQVLCVDGGMAM
ncbi:3-oxoacyl-[acyl-carrier-protein] reductase [Sedimentisphaera salicampi]|uniref:3-oxoacyl-[acyl-carrier-protein] reductase n=1 Tax=Sedimentisphaera salicampi TaxID=1941349 RepID=A0A1W6LKW0_9BACT|nr:3-oxoacyl-[acyl-carrier-protein] reductase [Sedimentisphaera salicampi]ARN56382.1 3-oxoacyl-[acyl-carrier-protein] reductase FabG [Sedimentisphaera salicampi]